MKKLTQIFAMLLVVLMFASVLPVDVFAATAAGGYDDSNGGSDYYNVISEKEWDISPGIQETELVLNNDGGTRRQVLHTAIVDVNNPFVKVIPGTKGMWPQEGNYGTQSTSTQALEAEKLGYGNVVVATNCSLSWYTEDYYKSNPHLIGEPLGYSILNGEYYCNSRITNGTLKTGGVKTIVVINYDYHPVTGEKRPDDMPKTWIRSSTDPLTGWEEQAIPVLFDLIVKPDANGNPVNLYKVDHGSGIASRTFVGVRADGTLVVAVSDGEQAPYSTGFTSYEMAEYMIKMGCVIAANCDGGGSTTFCSQRPGEDLKVNCSLSDGGERPTSNTILVISTAPADGQFARATMSTEYDYYTPGSSVTFNALGTDAVGTKVDIPADVKWQIKESGMGTISNGVFVSNGTEGIVTAQMVYDGNVVGEKTITIATPDTLYFEQPIVTIPFGKTAKIPVKATATINGVAFEIGLGNNDVTFTTTNTLLGNFDGLNFIAVSEENAPDDITSTVTATLNMGTKPTAEVQLNLGKGSEVLWDFEGGQSDIDEWNVVNNRKNAAHWDYELNLSLADSTNGKIHDGNYSMRLETNGLSSKDSHSEQYAWIRMGVDGEALVLKNAKRVGFWLYVPEDNIQCWVQMHYKTDSNGDGVFDTDNVVSVMESENVYYNIDESGWHYLSMDISAFSEIMLAADKKYDKDPSDGMTGEKGEFFLALVFHKAINNKLWQENGSINGNYTYYLDNFTVDYSDAVEDRENPVFDKIYLDKTTALVKRDVITTTNNVLNLSAAVADQSTRLDADKNEVALYNASGLNASTAKVYIDGVEIESAFADGVLSANTTVADGYHRVKFEICDNAGNKSVVIRVVKVESGTNDSTLKLVPADSTLDRIHFGSIYWMNLEATAIETIQKVETVIDLNNVNHWQLDHMKLAEGFTAEYTINEETNTAIITITRTGTNYDNGAAILAKLPVRILYFDTDIQTPGYTAETYWTTYPFWAQDMKMDVDMGLITHINGSTSTFSNEEFHVDTEMYTSMANMDKSYFTAHGTTHVHTPVALVDKAPTCTETGYTDRTFCEICNSVVEWGTTIPATGHTFEVSGDMLVCDCGREFTGTGIQNIDGKNYYTVNGKFQTGWIGIDDDWYYFDKTTFEGWNGERYTDDAIKFVFDNGKVTDGTWVKMRSGIRYWFGPGYYRDMSPETTSSRPYVIDGKTYLFNRYGYMQTGIAKYFDATTMVGKAGTSIYYDCGEDGVASLYTGPYGDYFYIDGSRVKETQIIESNGDFYYVGSGYKLAKNTSLYFAERFVNDHYFADGTPMHVGRYEIDADGKFIIKNGPVGNYFYKNDVIVKGNQIVVHEGNFYYIGANNLLAKNTSLYFADRFVNGHYFADGTPMHVGRYEIDADGKFIIKNGPVGNYFYKNDVIVKGNQIVEFEGDFYYIGTNNLLAKSKSLYFTDRFVNGHYFADGTPMHVGRYEIDADGKFIIKNGPVGNYFYKNDIMIKGNQIVEYEGNFYYIGVNNVLAKNTSLYFADRFVNGHYFADGSPMHEGRYEIDADGKFIIKNGPVGNYFYKNDIMVKGNRIVEFEGNYYYVGANNLLAKNTSLYFTEKFVEGTSLSVGRYEIDADGKLSLESASVVKNGPVGDYFYSNGKLVTGNQLIEFEGEWYYIGVGNKLAKNSRLYFTAKFVAGKTYADGCMIEIGYHSFDENGKMIS